MGLRDRKTSRIREPGYNGHESGGLRRVLSQGAQTIRRLITHATQGVRGMGRPDLAGLLVQEKDDGRAHFAETAVGGVTITCGALGGIMVILWLGTFF